jgi:cobalt-zinc-cadmium efflux system protein
MHDHADDDGHKHDHKHDHAKGGHGHSHGPGGHHHPAPDKVTTSLVVGVVLNSVFIVAEIFYGLVANSVALLADAFHNAGDVLGLVLVWVAIWLAKRQPSPRRTYGYLKTSIFAALLNAAILLVSSGAIAWEAALRLAEPQPIVEGTVIWVALIGVAINGFSAWLIQRQAGDDINMRGAFLHLAADAALSLGVVVAAVVIGWTGWLILDPLVSLVIVAVIAGATWGLLRDSVLLSLDAVPSGIDHQAVDAYLAGLPGVTGVHDLHIWPLSTTETAMTAHLVRPGAGHDDAFLAATAETLRERFNIGHATLQVESDGTTCRLAPAHVI